jgi:hypothetical protein
MGRSLTLSELLRHFAPRGELESQDVSADTSLMDEASRDELRRELEALEAREALVSAQRRRLHEQLDFGYASETTRAREREISDERHELHRRIDALRELLGTSESPDSERTALT